MRCFRLCLCLFLVCVVSLAAPAQRPPSPMERGLVLTEEDAYGLLPQELVAAPTVMEMVFSSDGRYLLVSRMSMRITPELLNQTAGMPPQMPTGETGLVLWDSRTRRPREVWKTESVENSVESIHWLPKSKVALALVRQVVPPDPAHPERKAETRQQVLRITGGVDRAIPIPLPDEQPEEYKRLYLSPTQPMAILQRSVFPSRKVPQPDGAIREIQEPQQILHLIGEEGRLGAAVTLPKEVWLQEVAWAEDGSPLLHTARVKEGKAGIVEWYALETRRGELRLLPKPPALYRGNPPGTAATTSGPLQVKLVNSVVKEGETVQSIGLLWLESRVKTERPRALVSGDSSRGQLIARENVIVYSSQGAVWATPLLKMNKQQYLAMQRAAQKAVLISNAKQLGLSLMMYAQDNDEKFPTGEDINNKISAYLMNASLFDGFTYTYEGGPLSEIPNPSETILGHVSGAGGRAIIYADGHVRWQDD